MLQYCPGIATCRLPRATEENAKQGNHLPATSPRICFLPGPNLEHPSTATHNPKLHQTANSEKESKQCSTLGQRYNCTLFSDQAIPSSGISPQLADLNKRNAGCTPCGESIWPWSTWQLSCKRKVALSSTGRREDESQGPDLLTDDSSRLTAHAGQADVTAHRSGAQDRPSYCPIFAPSHACSGSER